MEAIDELSPTDQQLYERVKIKLQYDMTLTNEEQRIKDNLD